MYDNIYNIIVQNMKTENQSKCLKVVLKIIYYNEKLSMVRHNVKKITDM